jgi:hypothetical protein
MILQQVIDVLRRRQLASPVDIAAAVGSTSDAVRSMLATLQHKGLVVRYRPPTGCGTACRQCAQGDIELYCLADAEGDPPHIGDCAPGD